MLTFLGMKRALNSVRILVLFLISFSEVSSLFFFFFYKFFHGCGPLQMHNGCVYICLLFVLLVAVKP